MRGEFQAIYDEFCDELDGILGFTDDRAQIEGRRLSARARITASNSATLLLAALYEECVRQFVKTTYRLKRSAAANIGAFPDKLVANVWRRSFDRLARRNILELAADRVSVDRKISGIVSFCLRGDLAADVEDALAHNENNMRPDEMAGLFKQLGVASLMTKLGEQATILSRFSAQNPGQATDALRAYIEDFFTRRNEIAHAVQIGASSGSSELHKDVETFRVIGAALGEVLTSQV